MAAFDRGGWPRTLGLALAAIVVVGGAVWWLWRSSFFGKPEPGAASAESPVDDGARKKRACEAARRRFYAGADMGVDSEGWVIELWLARAVDRGPLASDAALVREVERARAGFASLGSVEMSLVQGEASGALGMDNAVVRMSGALTTAFFESDGRARIETSSAALAHAAAAGQAALYARCEHLAARDVGAWFFGSDRDAALSALIYTMGQHAEPPTFDVDKLRGGTLVALHDKLAGFDRNKIDDVLRPLAARLVEPDAGAGETTIRFVVGGPTHAVKASRELALALGLAP
jgi:hypothetical protein